MPRAYCISRQQRDAHVVFEGLAVFGVVPFYVWLATRGRQLNKAEKVGLIALAGTTLLVDGALLASYAESRARNKSER